DRAGTVAAYLSSARPTVSDAINSRGPLIADALLFLRRAEPLIQAIGKQAIISDYQSLLMWAAENQNAAIETLRQIAPLPIAVAPPAAVIREGVVGEYVALLNAARPGSSSFGDALEKLSSDRRVRKQEMVAIVRQTADPSFAPSATKAAA